MKESYGFKMRLNKERAFIISLVTFCAAYKLETLSLSSVFA